MSAVHQYGVDTNVIIRLLSGDHTEHSPAAKRVFTNAYHGQYSLWIHPIVIAECCYVLEGKYYEYDRSTIASALTMLLKSKGIKSYDRAELLEALSIYAETNVDFEDALLSVFTRNSQFSAIISFNDKDFTKCGVKCCHPLNIK